MLGIPVGLAVFGAGEWAIHKYLLHGLGRDRNSRFSFHYHDHHQAVRRNGGYDPAYEGPVWSTPTQSREAVGLTLVALAHVPLFPLAPFYTSTIWYCLYRYRRDHRHAHLDPEWARDHLPWHYDHHMGRDQNANWCVTHPWFDHVMGTRKKYQYDEKGRVLGEQTPPAVAARVERLPRFARAKQRLRAALRNVRLAV